VAKMAEKVGYKSALTCDFGRVRKGSDPLKMKRFVIDDKMDFAAFRKYLGATPLQLAEMSPKPGVVEPTTVTISAKIPAFKNLDPKSVGMALLSAGAAIPYSYDARSGAITMALQNAISTLKTKYHRAVVWGTDLKTGKRVEATWVFRVPDPAMPEPPPAQQPPPAVTARVMGTTAAAASGSPKR
ncbi:MAG TPA: hypothetical protein VF608_00280, partial [Thermoanaerobaculia bacterium]